MDQRPFSLFVSYAQADEAMKDELLKHLAILQREGLIQPWTDRQVVPGERWEPAIFERLQHADLVLLLVSADFLASDFVFEREMQRALERHAYTEAIVVPVILRPCDWTTAPFAKLQALPKDARPVSTWADLDAAWLDVVSHLRRLLDRSPRERGHRARSPIRVSTSMLPATSFGELLGRDAELAQLDDAWRDDAIRVVVLVAIGGAGKTALVDHWLQRLEQDGWRGAEVVYGWSFGQGSNDDRQVSGDEFVDAALRFFGDQDPSIGSPRDRGLRLAAQACSQRSLLILDGLEAIQEPPTSSRAGRIRDPAVAALVRELASTQPGLLVVTTREPVADLVSRFGKSVRSIALDRLSHAAGVRLLERLGVDGPASELGEVVEALHGHALSVGLIGRYLCDAHVGDVRSWGDLSLLDSSEAMGDPDAARFMASYGRLFDGPERQILLVLGLFDRPADLEAITELRGAPPIPGLTDQLVSLSVAQWNTAIGTLRRRGLVLSEPSDISRSLDTATLVREYFGRLLETEQPEAFQAGHERLYLHYADAAEDQPDTLEGLQPLYRAVHHGCRAGRRAEVFDEIYQRRILRGPALYSIRWLGAFGSELGVLTSFFDRTWDHPGEDLEQVDRVWLLRHAAFCLRALGRLDEAVRPMELAARSRADAEGWAALALDSANLSELLLVLGRIGDALAHGESSVDFATRGDDAWMRAHCLAVWGAALHASGRFDEALSAFEGAVTRLHSSGRPRRSLDGRAGFFYGELLLDLSSTPSTLLVGGPAPEATGSQAVARQAIEAAEQAMNRTVRDAEASLLTMALAELGFGRAELVLALARGRGVEESAASIERAMDALRRAGAEEFVAHGLVARAMTWRLLGRLDAAEADLREALEIAERGSMRLLLCDVHLEWTRSRFAGGDTSGAREHLAHAAEWVRETGYHRRDSEVEHLWTTLSGEGRAAETPEPAADAAAERGRFSGDPLWLSYLLVLERRLPVEALQSPRAPIILDAVRALAADHDTLSEATPLDEILEWLVERHGGARPNALWHRWFETSHTDVARRLREDLQA